jgi:hypothetical protein
MVLEPYAMHVDFVRVVTSISLGSLTDHFQIMQSSRARWAASRKLEALIFDQNQNRNLSDHRRDYAMVYNMDTAFRAHCEITCLLGHEGRHTQ